MERIRSRDGTEIAFYKSGTGPQLVVIHGTVAANPMAWPAHEAIAEKFTVCAMDRRGRRASLDGAAYALEREFEDVAAVAGAVGESVVLLGHSFGALCALGAAPLIPNLRALILYEPFFALPGVPAYPDGLIERLQGFLRAGEREQALIEHYSGVMSPDELKRYRTSPAWDERLLEVHTLPREMRAEAGYVLDPQQLREIAVPTLLLAGSASPRFLRAVTDTVHAALQDSRIVILAGQGHLAMYTAPELFAREVTSFVEKAKGKNRVAQP